MRLYTIFTLLMLLCFSGSALAESAADGNGFGGLMTGQGGSKINWGNGFISATAKVLPMQDSIDPLRTRALAVRQGGVESRKLLLDTVLALSLDGKKNISTIYKDDLKTMNTLRGFIHNSLISTSLIETQAVEVMAFLNVRNGLSSIIIPPTIPFLSGIPPTISGKRSEGSVLQELAESDDLSVREAAVNSGIIIDARGFNITPVLLPLIYDGKGVGVYGPFAVSRASVIKHGMVSYMTDASAESIRERVGNFPLTVKPVNTNGASKSNFILSLDDGAKVRAVLKRKSVSENCAVVILVDGPEAKVVTDDQNLSVGSAQSVGKIDTTPVVLDNSIQEDSLDDNAAIPAQQ